MIELIHNLFRLSKGNSVFIIDEVERSLHVLLIKKLFDFMLNHEQFKNLESQLIASTHEVLLLDKKLFRKDEIWFIAKENGESRAYSLANVEVDDLDLVKGYINNRFGAIPFIIPDVNKIYLEK
jgi:AAA15 family ATPase/GTPase